MNSDQNGTDQTGETQPAEAQRVEPQAQPAESQQPEKPQLPDPRRRLRELLAIPERDRSDAQWDEAIELEIQLAPGNRAQQDQRGAVNHRQQEPGRRQDMGRRGDQVRRKEPGSGNQPGKPFVRKPKRNQDARPKK